MPKQSVYGPKPGRAAEWRFEAAASLRKHYPDAPEGEFGMDLQDGEVMILEPTKSIKANGALVCSINEGQVHLLNVAEEWQLLKAVPEDSIEWDIERIVEAWSSD